jgi:hypothetical protein
MELFHSDPLARSYNQASTPESVLKEERALRRNLHPSLSEKSVLVPV